MKLIKIKTSRFGTIWVNPDHIVSVQPDDETPGRSRLDVVQSEAYALDQPTEKLVAEINRCMKKQR